MKKERILVIRLGALGDLILCFDAFASLRKAYPDAEIALLTMKPFAAFAETMPWFDKILIDPRAPRWRLDAWFRLVRLVRGFAPTRIFDFQCKSRQAILYWLLGGCFFGPLWSGAAKFCSHPRPWPPAAGRSCGDQLLMQVESAGVSSSKANLDWFGAGIERLALPKLYALLIPGCAPEHGHKRWPASSYAALARHLKAKGIDSVAIGTAADQEAIDAIRAEAPGVVDLCGFTSLLQIGTLARKALLVVGNDTGPTHIAAAVGAKTLALMSDKVNPLWSAPRGANASWLQGKPLSSLTVETVWDTIKV